MAFSTTIRSTLHSSKTAYGFWLTLPSAALARTIIKGVPKESHEKFSWTLLDAEHGLVTDADYYALTNAVASEGVSPIIRIPWSEEWMIKRALDAGAHGIVTPMCHTAADARRIVSFSKYPPVGSRGYGPMFATHAMPGVAAGPQHDDGANDSLLVIVQIESRSGVENVEGIAGTEGVDVLFIGPFDLAKSMAVIHGGDEHESAIARVLQASHAAGKKAAIFCLNGNEAHKRIHQGFDMVSVGTDINAVAAKMTSELSDASGMA